MPTKHVTKQLEAYLDNRLSPEERHRVETHLAACSVCEQRLFEARRLGGELGPLMKKVLGDPSPPLALRYQIRRHLHQTTDRHFQILWAASGRVLNAVGTLVIVAILLWGAFLVLQSQLPEPETASDEQPAEIGSDENQKTPLETPPPEIKVEVSSTPTPNFQSFGESLPSQVKGDVNETDSIERETNQLVEESPQPKQRLKEIPIDQPKPSSKIPDGMIAFSFFNSGAQFYEIHLINPDGTNRRRFPIDGVSEPALRRSESGEYQIAYRAWGEPTTPRALISNDLANHQPDTLTHFWEDGHPDWSPTENRIIFASQRESDRRWRLYTVWGDGSAEENLRREGKSPTFAPDGLHFAFVGCEDPLNKIGCGLLVSNLDNSEHTVELILENSLVESPDWSPAGEQIAYMANPNGNWDVYVVNSNGRNVRRLTNDPAIDGLPTWSPDGQWLAFLSNRSGKWAVWAIHIDSGRTQLVVDFNEGDFMSPVANPLYQNRDWQDEQLSWSR